MKTSILFPKRAQSWNSACFFPLCLLFIISIAFSISLHGEEESSPPSTELSKKIEEAKKTAASEDNNFQERNMLADIMHVTSMLVLLILLIILAAWGTKKILSFRMAQMNDKNAIKILAQRSISPKSVIYVVEVEKRTLVVAESAAGVHTLTAFYPEMGMEE